MLRLKFSESDCGVPVEGDINSVQMGDQIKFGSKLYNVAKIGENYVVVAPIDDSCPGCGGNSGCDRNHGSDLRERAEKVLDKLIEDFLYKAPEQRDDPDIRERWIEWIMDVHQ